MRSLISLGLLVFCSSPAFATIRVGDSVLYSIKEIANDGAEVSGTIRTTVTKVDRGADQFTFTNEVHFKDNQGTSEYQMPISGFEDHEDKLERDLDGYCSHNSTIEIVATAAGTFRSCKVKLKTADGVESYQWQAARTGLSGFAKQETLFKESGKRNLVEVLEIKPGQQ